MFSMAARPSAPREESPVDALPQIAASLQNLDAQIKALAPIFQDSGREVLRKWLSCTVTASEAAAALQAMALASSAMGNQN